MLVDIHAERAINPLPGADAGAIVRAMNLKSFIDLDVEKEKCASPLIKTALGVIKSLHLAAAKEPAPSLPQDWQQRLIPLLNRLQEGFDPQDVQSSQDMQEVFSIMLAAISRIRNDIPIAAWNIYDRDIGKKNIPAGSPVSADSSDIFEIKYLLNYARDQAGDRLRTCAPHEKTRLENAWMMLTLLDDLSEGAKTRLHMRFSEALRKVEDGELPPRDEVHAANRLLQEGRLPPAEHYKIRDLRNDDTPSSGRGIR
jgi:hypothetical protein